MTTYVYYRLFSVKMSKRQEKGEKAERSFEGRDPRTIIKTFVLAKCLADGYGSVFKGNPTLYSTSICCDFR